ncbi:exocyst complex component 7 [Vigna unguiculata]|uniref:Exocyst subunit Exo70 family protein n=1 Tax=Vigna unguiculata TaxID=3917 RepID=A0A4D6MK76_VIGUN|nr:exocyst complex component 7 [Vigna unguiculata]
MLIEIHSRVLQPKVWRFVCFVSSIVGLVCYALSSSFNHLCGAWKWWKIFLFIGFSMLISLSILFAKAWEGSNSRCLEAHTAFLVLLITSVYSFFFDKQVTEKPDAYSLVSCGSFAIMSLGLSRLSHFGFEVDLLYFFSGFLTVQLMKIKLWLVIVGGSFSYFLLILRAALDASARDGYVGLHVNDHVVIEIGSHSQGTSRNFSQVGSPQTITTFVGNSLVMPQDAGVSEGDEDSGFMVTQGRNDSNKSVKARFMKCVEVLEKENKTLIDTISKHVDGYLKANVINKIPVVELHADNNLVVDSLPAGTINDLHETVRLMLAEGFEEDCCGAYYTCRREFLKECLWTFGLQMQEFSTEEIDMMEKIQCWLTKVLNIVDCVLLPSERTLCDRVFKGVASPGDFAFDAVCRELNICLLRIANHLATFLECEKFTYYEGGEVHPNICELMLKIRFVCRQRDNRSRQGLEGYNMLGKEGKLSPSVNVARIIATALLERILEVECKNYHNPSLGYVFLMNNLSFIEQEAKFYGLVPIFSHDWLRKMTTKFQQNLELYLRSSWTKIVDFLKLDISESENSVGVELVKDRMNSFNEHFDEICKVQSTWFVFDEELKSHIIKSIENMLLPAYGNFIERLQNFLGQHSYYYIKYGMFDVQDRVRNLFVVMKNKNLFLNRSERHPRPLS